MNVNDIVYVMQDGFGIITGLTSSFSGKETFTVYLKKNISKTYPRDYLTKIPDRLVQ